MGLLACVRPVARAVEKLSENVDAAWRLRDRALVEDVTRLQERLFPDGVPQERAFGRYARITRFVGETRRGTLAAKAVPATLTMLASMA